MKKIHSNRYCHKIIGLAGLLLAVIPFPFYVLHTVFHAIFFTVLMYISLITGFLVLIFLIVLLGIEFHQDKKIDLQYNILKKTKISLGNGFYECQLCGNRQVKKTDENCGICGVKFMKGV